MWFARDKGHVTLASPGGAVIVSVARGGKSKNAAGKGKKSMKGGKKESYDLIVNIDLEEWKLTPEQVTHPITQCLPK